MEDKKQYEKFIHYEKVLGQFFKELELKPNQCQLIRAFMLVSKGETIFETSFNELGAVFHKKTTKSRIDSMARTAFKGLVKWQNESQMELVRVLKQGHQIADKTTGKIDYVKTKYEFIALDEMVKILYSDAEDLEAKIQELITKIKTNYKPVDRSRKYHPLHNLRKVKKTILTKVAVMYELATQAGLNPQAHFENIINEAGMIFNNLVLETEYERNSQKFIKQFEQKLNKYITMEEVSE